MIDSGGIEGELVGEFETSCVGGKTHTSFRVCRKTPVQKKWTTDVGMQKCVDALDNLTCATFKKHLMELGTKVGLSHDGIVKRKRKRKKPDLYSPSW